MASKKFSYQTLLRTLEEEDMKPASKRVRETLRLTYEGHCGQFRDTRTSDTRIPFIVHPVATARLAIKYFPIVEHKLADDLETVVCIALASISTAALWDFDRQGTWPKTAQRKGSPSQEG